MAHYGFIARTDGTVEVLDRRTTATAALNQAMHKCSDGEWYSAVCADTKQEARTLATAWAGSTRSGEDE